MISPARIEVFRHLFSAVAEEMGVALQRSAFSPNIKERRDYSCALFDGRGQLVAQAAHIPVHLGSAPLSVRAAIAAVPLSIGDMAVLNDPFAGGTHLPDLTVVAPVCVPGSSRPLAYVANRAHHADVGGEAPGSMPIATHIDAEGVRIPPRLLLQGGAPEGGFWRWFLSQVRTPEEREGDLWAQVAAARLGIGRMADLARRYGAAQLDREMSALNEYAERRMQAVISGLASGTFRFEDALDDDGTGVEEIRIRATVTLDGGRACVDFTGSSPQVPGGINAVFAVTLSAVGYAFRCLGGEGLPHAEGALRPIEVIAVPGSIVNAQYPAAVAAGNVETSQRIVDVVLGALAQAAPERVPAASQGTMNNVLMGGMDARRNRPFTYYETLAGGAGGGPAGCGESAVHTHMTNTRNTPVEALEHAYPLRVWRYAVRRGSGGSGLHGGGDGLVREVEALGEMEVTLLGDRRRRGPWGLAGGGAGATGRDTLIRSGVEKGLPAKGSLVLKAGDRLRIETPGGGGWGKPL